MVNPRHLHVIYEFDISYNYSVVHWPGSIIYIVVIFLTVIQVMVKNSHNKALGVIRPHGQNGNGLGERFKDSRD